jgi:nitrite reductase/ring-hydroxylating ferredoxin subunit/uncharacterized membrane protein
MRRTAHFKGHPLHPALIPFPFAFLTGALLCDALGWLLDLPSLTATGLTLIIGGIAAGLIAAVPGLIDYRHTVPPRSSGKRRARRHGLLNLAALSLFSASLAFRDDTLGPMPASLGFELAGTAALLYAGWLGGVLVNRNMIGVDHRYANAGKWKEATLKADGGVVVAGRDGELEPGQMKLLHIGDRRIVLGRTARGYVAFDDRCTHRGGSLAGGVLIDSTVQCLWHGSQFDVDSGRVRCGPANDAIATHAVEIKNGDVRISLGRR